MSRVTVGIDPSSRILTAVIGRPEDEAEPHTCQHAQTTLSDQEMTKRVQEAREWAHEVYDVAVTLGDELMVGIEAPVLGVGGAMATIKQSIIHGALVAAFIERGAQTIVQVNNSAWKRQTVGNGSAKKDVIAEWVREYLPDYYAQHISPKRGGGIKIDQDSMDAVCIWLYMVELSDRLTAGLEIDSMETRKTTKRRTKATGDT